MKTIGITGGTGFVGKYVTALLVNKGYNVIIFTTGIPKKAAKEQISYARWNPQKGAIDKEALAKLHGMVHLAGAGIADKRWTDKRKQEIADSRVKGTNFIVAQLKEHGKNCSAFVAASATGFYGADRGGGAFTEEATPSKDFLGETCRLWEEASHKAEASLRTVILRFGIVLGKESGAFPEFVKPMSFGVMPILGNGGQMVSWIAVTDLARLIEHGIADEQLSGIYNAVAPHPVAHWQLMKTIAKEKGGLKIPVHVPAALLKILLGEMSVEVLKSCTVSADKTQAAGFSFEYPELPGAVKAILAK